MVMLKECKNQSFTETTAIVYFGLFIDRNALAVDYCIELHLLISDFTKNISILYMVSDSEFRVASDMFLKQ